MCKRDKKDSKGTFDSYVENKPTMPWSDMYQTKRNKINDNTNENNF